MAVSQNTEFVSTRSDIIRDSYALLNVYGSSESVSAEDYEFANRILNRMVKSWMARGYHLWLKETAYLFPQKEQSLYRISSTSTDNVTLQHYQTTVDTAGTTGDNFVIVDDVSNMTVNDYVGVVLDDNSAFWSTIDSIAVNQVNFAAGDLLPSDVSVGKKVYNYTTKLPNPLNVYSGVRSEDTRDIPLNYLSYEEYFELPNKEDTTSTPVSYNYDRQLQEAVIRLWPNPDTANILIKLTLSRKIANFDVNSDEPDFPMEWHESIVYNLAVRLAPAFGKNKDSGYQMLVVEAAGTLQSALSFDNEMGSIYIKPDFHNG